MLYIVNFDIKDSARVEQFARQLDEVGETLLFMPRCYFLKTNESVSGMSVLKTEDIHPPKTGISVHFSGSLV